MAGKRRAKAPPGSVGAATLGPIAASAAGVVAVVSAAVGLLSQASNLASKVNVLAQGLHAFVMHLTRAEVVVLVLIIELPIVWFLRAIRANRTAARLRIRGDQVSALEQLPLNVGVHSEGGRIVFSRARFSDYMRDRFLSGVRVSHSREWTKKDWVFGRTVAAVAVDGAVDEALAYFVSKGWIRLLKGGPTDVQMGGGDMYDDYYETLRPKADKADTPTKVAKPKSAAIAAKRGSRARPMASKSTQTDT